jgi:hypothetical protein
LKKIEKIRIFLKQYEVLINSISDFKKNLQFIKKYTINKSHNYDYNRKDSNCISSRNSKESSVNEINNNDNFNYTNGKSNSLNLRSSYLYKKNNYSKLSSKIFLDGNKNSNGNKINYYFDLLENIKKIGPNFKQNKLFIYDYYKALSIFYAESKKN